MDPFLQSERSPQSRSSQFAGPPRHGFADAYKILNDAIREHSFPGCAFGVLVGNNVVLADALGKFTYEPDAPPVQAGTVFDVASLTKVVATTAAAMLLHQRGVLELETPLSVLLPGFIQGRENSSLARQVTLRHLLAHSSGLPGYREIFRTAQTPEGIYQACLALPIEAAPGTRMEYSDPGFILLGKALEVLTREPLDIWVQREVLTPLEMTASGFCPSPATWAQIPPTEIDQTLRKRVIQGEVEDEHAYLLKGVAGHAGVFANVPDLLRFAKALLAAVPPASGKETGQVCEPATGQALKQAIEQALKQAPLFHADTVHLFAQRQSPLGSSRALGWDTPSENSSAGQYFSANSIGHLGFSGCSLWIDRTANIAVILLSNRTWPDRSAEGIRGVRPRFHNAIRQALQI